MQSVPVVADPVSRHKCAHCHQEQEGPQAQHVCVQCGTPQPLLDSETYFTALGVPKKFNLDHAEVEKRFYEISRALHPDRFTNADIQSRVLSLERMSFLNRAY